MGRDYSWVQPRQVGSPAEAWGPVLVESLLGGLFALASLGWAVVLVVEPFTWPTLPVRMGGALLLMLLTIAPVAGIWDQLQWFCRRPIRLTLGPEGLGLLYPLGGRSCLPWDDVLDAEVAEPRAYTPRAGCDWVLNTLSGEVTLPSDLGPWVADILYRRSVPHRPAPGPGAERLGLAPGESVVWRQPVCGLLLANCLPWAGVAMCCCLARLAWRADPFWAQVCAALLLATGLLVLCSASHGELVPARRWTVTLTPEGIERRQGQTRVWWAWDEWTLLQATPDPHLWVAHLPCEMLCLDDSDARQARIVDAIRAALAWRETLPAGVPAWVASTALSRTGLPPGAPSASALSRARVAEWAGEHCN